MLLGDPDEPGPNLPPAGRSLFDELFEISPPGTPRPEARYDLPFPFERLLDAAERPDRAGQGDDRPDPARPLPATFRCRPRLLRLAAGRGRGHRGSRRPRPRPPEGPALHRLPGARGRDRGHQLQRDGRPLRVSARRLPCGQRTPGRIRRAVHMRRLPPGPRPDLSDRGLERDQCRPEGRGAALGAGRELPWRADRGWPGPRRRV